MIDNNDWSDLNKFVHAGAKIGEPYITISPRKSITLSSGFMHQAKENVEGKTHVIFLYSKSKNAIVFDFTDKGDDEGAIKMTIGSNVSLASRSFFNYYMIDINDAAGKYIAKLEKIPNHGDSWVIYLDEKVL